MRFVKTFSESADTKIEYINLSKAFDEASKSEKKDLVHLVENMYFGLYSETFTIEEEREGLDFWLDVLNKGSKKGQRIYVIFGYNLSTPTPDIIGFTIANIGGRSNCGQIDYVVRKRNFSSVLRGRDMLSYTEKELNALNKKLTGQKLKGIFWEANDPLKTDPSADCMPPQKRIDLIQKRFGAKELGFHYTQVPLFPCQTQQEAESLICTNLKLYLYNAQVYPDLTAQDVKNYICAFSKAINGLENPRNFKSPELNKMLNELDLMIEHHISPLLEKQTPEQRAMLKQI